MVRALVCFPNVEKNTNNIYIDNSPFQINIRGLLDSKELKLDSPVLANKGRSMSTSNYNKAESCFDCVQTVKR